MDLQASSGWPAWLSRRPSTVWLGQYATRRAPPQLPQPRIVGALSSLTPHRPTRAVTSSPFTNENMKVPRGKTLPSPHSPMGGMGSDPACADSGATGGSEICILGRCQERCHGEIAPSRQASKGGKMSPAPQPTQEGRHNERKWRAWRGPWGSPPFQEVLWAKARATVQEGVP